MAESCKGRHLLSFLFPPGTTVRILRVHPGGASSCSIIQMVFHNHNLMKTTRVPTLHRETDVVRIATKTEDQSC